MDSSPNSTNLQKVQYFSNDSNQKRLQSPSALNSDEILVDKSGTKKARRRQVKNACVNCQRACKKCDDGRPCQRCINYSLTETCRDSVRKERKKGIKRGPYKLQQKKAKRIEKEDKKNIGEITKSTYDNGGVYHTGFLSKQQLEKSSLLHKSHNNIVAPSSTVLHSDYNNSNNIALTPSFISRHDIDSLMMATTATNTISSFQLQQQPILNEHLDAYLSLYNDNQHYQVLQMYTAAASSTD